MEDMCMINFVFTCQDMQFDKFKIIKDSLETILREMDIEPINFDGHLTHL